jgi:hypothetical protein
MSISVVLHILGGGRVLAEIDELPDPRDRLIKLNNPRSVEGKDLDYLMDKVVTVLWPLDKINFIEILSGEEDEDVFGFVRE